jgi:hypothetical protein
VLRIILREKGDSIITYIILDATYIVYSKPWGLVVIYYIEKLTS